MATYRKLAGKVTELHNKYGGSVVAVGDGSEMLDDVGRLQLRIAESGLIFEVPAGHLTRKIVRKAFWELRHRREWERNRGVVWSSLEGGTSYVGLGEMVPPETPMPALTKMTIVGGTNG